VAYGGMTITIRTPGLHPQIGSHRSTADAMLRGLRGRCPACGKGRMFYKYLKVADHCPACGEALHHQRADDAPPYFTMFVVCHIVVAGLLVVEKTWHPSLVTHLAIWMPLALALSLILLPMVKGTLIGLQWALHMHGFGAGVDPADPTPIPDAVAAKVST
jgi:uncharacterized protein (DUF983 family)